MSVTSRMHTVDELATILNMTPEAVRRHIRGGRIPAIKFGRDYQIAPSLVEQLLQGTYQVPTPAPHNGDVTA